MIYRVKGKYIESELPEFYRKLTDGTIAAQKPEGREIIDSMDRARIIGPDQVQWSETCYCSPPLRHERQTVYDRYFTDIETEPIDAYEVCEGQPFMDFLADQSA